jgi:2-polyprenyl-3-methyl-5-hydroxy-6-metoxy-1,4-benzoquinol methylase
MIEKNKISSSSIKIDYFCGMEDSNWFASWFDTKYYHILYKNRNNQEAERFIGNLVDFMKLPQGSKVLDLACGKGRHSLTLFTHGYEVLGVDLSEQSIDYAENFNNPHLQFQVHDMREVIESHTFDAVFNLFTSFGYFDSEEDNLKMLQSIHTMLHPNGSLLIDFMNAQKVVDQLVKEETKVVDDITFSIKREYDGKHIFKNIQFDADGEHHNHTERVQALKLEDFKQLLEATNFELLHTFGSFDLESFNPSTSDRLILLAKKR